MRFFERVYTALITPFFKGEVDWESLGRLLEQQTAAGITGFVVNGTTGESPTLTENEVAEIFRFVRQKVSKETLLVLGTGTNSTKETIRKTQAAKELGADAALVVVPYYNKPPQRGLVQHFMAVAQSTNLPIILYNVPGRTIADLSVESVAELSKEKRIVGIKDATGKPEVAKSLRQNCRSDFVLLSGDDGTYLEFLRAGGRGIISVATHLFPEEFLTWTRRGSEGLSEEDIGVMKHIAPVIDNLFIEANPIPVKMALCKMGLIRSAELRLPLVEMEKTLAEKLESSMQRAGLL
ncbi:MAG: 4-hydroxy-tetrahydrodipicolinate synthase [Bdellovibrionaceae bacterium]|nr:4-hydroxy-tetrahydrodipicolinate synthase [Pseudobdellovibrionaceae bacterium]